MSVCLELSSSLANQASSEKSENSNTIITTSHTTVQSSLSHDDKKQATDVASEASSNGNVTKTLSSTVSTSAITTTSNFTSGNSTLSSLLQKNSSSTPAGTNSNSLITVVNTQGPVTIVKSLNNSFPSNHHFTLVSSSPLTVSNGLGKQITVVPNPPYTLVRPQTNETVPMTVIQQQQITNDFVSKISDGGGVCDRRDDGCIVTTSTPTMPSTSEKPVIHNVFVKNSTGTSDTLAGNPAVSPTVLSKESANMPQAQKLLMANNFPANNVLHNFNSQNLLKPSNVPKPAIQQNKLKIVSNVMIPVSGSLTTSSIGAVTVNNPNFIVNKTAAPVKYYPQQKVSGNTNATKFLGKPQIPALLKTVGSTMSKSLPPPPPPPSLISSKPSKMMYSTSKGHIKTLPPINNSNALKQNVGLKTIPPHYKSGNGSVSGGFPNQQVQRTGTGLKTIPPQRSKVGSNLGVGSQLNKPNYIGKHAIQGQKMRSPPVGNANKNKIASMKQQQTVSMSSPLSISSTHSNQQMVYTQALTAQIIETLNQNNGLTSSSYACSTGLPLSGFSSVRSRDAGLRYDGNYTYSNAAPPETPDARNVSRISPSIIDHKSQSGLDTLSLICQAVLLDHNYNATLPLETVPRPSSCNSTSPLHLNGAPNSSLYSPGSGTRGRSLASSNSVSALSTSSGPLVSSLSSSGPIPDDDVASDISCGSERRPETEGEETDTAPEAEAVIGNEIEHYGDYVNRCICGFDHDDGYMIECDRCKVWQHVRCVVKTKKVPDDFLCEVCDPTKVIDRTKAQLLQQQYLKDRGDPRFQKDLRLQQKLKEIVSDSDSSDGEHPPQHGNNVITKGRNFSARKREIHKSNIQQRRERASNRRPLKKEKKMTKRKTKAATRQQNHNQSHHISDEDQSNYSAAMVQDAAWPSSQLPQLRQWIENYEEAVTNHYSPELRARVSNIRINGAHSNLSAPFDCSVHSCRVQTQPLTGLKILVSTEVMEPHTPVIELRGKYMLSTQHRSATAHHSGSGGLTTRQHSQRPGPFLFFYRLQKDSTEVCVDTRTYGNDARFIRRSCKPNAEVRHCIEKGVLHLYIVTIMDVEKNAELTIKHESHDLAVVGTTFISCACGKPEECTVNRLTSTTGSSNVRRNGENMHESTNHRKTRGRRTVSSTFEHDNASATTPLTISVQPEQKIKEEKISPVSPVQVKFEKEVKAVKEEKKPEVTTKEKDSEKIKEENIKQESPVPELKEDCRPPSTTIPVKVKVEIKQEDTEDDDEKESQNNSGPSITTRRNSHHRHKSESSEEKTTPPKQSKDDKKKLSREERKIEAIMKAFERMEKQQQRKQEHQAKQVAAHHRRESDPISSMSREDEKHNSTSNTLEYPQQHKMRRRKRKGRARTVSTNSLQQRRSNRVNSADSSYATSGDEASHMLLSPNSSDNNNSSGLVHVKDGLSSPDKAAGLLLALANGDRNEAKSPIRDADSSSNSVHSSPETPLSSACLLVAAAVEPLEPGFKFPKTKKGLMNEWLNKSPECIQSASSISPSSLTPHLTSSPECVTGTTTGNFYENSVAAAFYSSAKTLAAFSQAAVANYCGENSQQQGSAKKRWLRQAISESPIESESPPLTEAVAPPKKRKLPRESLSNDATPPTTPTGSCAPVSLGGSERQLSAEQEGRVEIVLSGTDEDSPSNTLECDAVLKKRAAEMQQEFGKCVRLPEIRDTVESPLKATNSTRLCSMDPRLSRHMFNNSDHLVGTVEKTLSIFGFQDRKPEPPTKRKLSITEYRQRKKLTVKEKSEEKEEKSKDEDSNMTLSTATYTTMRQRSDSTSSATSFMSSDEELHLNELPQKPLSAFNSEPTELEKTRESVSLRLKKAFGLSVDEDARKTPLNVETLLNCNLSFPTKTSLSLASPTFPIPGSSDSTTAAAVHSTEHSPVVAVTENSLPLYEDATDNLDLPKQLRVDPRFSKILNSSKFSLETSKESNVDVMGEIKKENVEKMEVTCLIPEEGDKTNDTAINSCENDKEEEKSTEQVENVMEDTDHDESYEVTKIDDEEMLEEGTSYIPPFNNPLYPNSSTFSYGSVIDDDVPYEGRNPSPPPELSSGMAGNYQVS